jgi:ferredoxin
MRQRVTDPERCIQCSACEMACPVKAIECILGRYCVKADVCNNCRKCVEECPTGAADCFVEVARLYSVEEQSLWATLPLFGPEAAKKRT